jgi:hypothetical protein
LSCGFAGDVNKDGYADLIFGAQGATGGVKAYLVLGNAVTASTYSVTDVNNARTITYTSESSAGGLGSAVAGAGDVNQNGFDDFVICAPTITVGGLSQPRSL